MQALKKLEPLAKQRLFAVVHMYGRQRIITPGDLVMVDAHFPLQCGQKILLNKALVIGGKDFSIYGRPVLDKDVFRIEATVVEKTMTDPRLFYRSKARNNEIKKYFFQALPRTVFRINTVELKKMPE